MTVKDKLLNLLEVATEEDCVRLLMHVLPLMSDRLKKSERILQQLRDCEEVSILQQLRDCEEVSNNE